MRAGALRPQIPREERDFGEQDAYEFVLDREKFLAGKHGLRAVRADEPADPFARNEGDPFAPSVQRDQAVAPKQLQTCIQCHQVRGEGREVGPALTEVGTKLPKEALIEAILDPSAGISFGFEAWQVELKSGDEAYGLKANETADEVAIRDINGIITRYRKSEIASMNQSKTSIMPTGLQQTMTTQDFVDLIEYLAEDPVEVRVS